MRAAVIDRLGPAESIHMASIRVPQPSDDEVLVRVHVTTVNHVDTFVRSGSYRTPITFPFVVGRDLVGEVVEIGSGVTRFGRGDPVWCTSLGHGGRQGAGAELAVVPQDRLYAMPEGVDPIELVALAHPASTAWLALFEHGALNADSTVVVGGGAGNVGACAVALARAAGAVVVATASADSAEALRTSGATPLDYRSPTLQDDLQTTLPHGADVWLDTSGALDLAETVPLLAERGRVILIAGATRHDTLSFGDLYMHDRAVIGFAISNATVDELDRAARAVGDALASGVLPRLPIDRLPLERAGEAHAALESGSVRGRRIVLEVS
jgi:NADPH:quinone reductase-like Zn-dependent oxidoreductase